MSERGAYSDFSHGWWLLSNTGFDGAWFTAQLDNSGTLENGQLSPTADEPERSLSKCCSGLFPNPALGQVASDAFVRMLDARKNEV